MNPPTIEETTTSSGHPLGGGVAFLSLWATSFEYSVWRLYVKACMGICNIIVESLSQVVQDGFGSERIGEGIEEFEAVSVYG